jgi:hypothetical protein
VTKDTVPHGQEVGVYAKDTVIFTDDRNTRCVITYRQTFLTSHSDLLTLQHSIDIAVAGLKGIIIIIEYNGATKL